MSSRHSDPAFTVRPPAGLKDAAQRELMDRGLEMKAFVVACMSAVIADPDGFLDQLAEHWPAQKPRGRPRKTTAPRPPEHPQEPSSPTAPAPWSDTDGVPNALDILKDAEKD